METSSYAGSLSQWERRSRVLFWVLGLASGCILTYATRYYLNSDGINYIEMAEVFGRGEWSALVNLTESPGYAFVLGVAMMAFQPDRLAEVPVLKTVNFVGLVAAMAACELFVTRIRREVDDTEQIHPFCWIRALMYSFFLFAALDWIRMRLVAPDIFVCAIVLVAMSIVLWIRQTSPGLLKSLLLGGTCGIGYLFKSFFFPFSWVFFMWAGLVSGNLRKGVSTMVVAALAMGLVGSPLILALSEKVGRFSYGEAGNYNYAHFVAAKGEPISPPARLHSDPEVLGYDDGLVGECTYPAGFDLAAWSLGIRPVFDLRAQLGVLPGNLLDIYRQTPWLFLLVPIWFGVQAVSAAPRLGRIVPPSAVVMCGVTAMLGIGLFSLVVVEIRYVAPFLFLGFVGLLLAARHNGSTLPSGVLGLVLVGMLLFSVVDQAYRGLGSSSGKPSYRVALYGQWSLARFLNESGVRQGDKVGIVGSLSPYWARLAHVKIVAVVPDKVRFLSAGPQQRTGALRGARSIQAKAMIGYGDGFAELATEGWQSVPGSLGYYCKMIDRGGHGE